MRAPCAVVPSVHPLSISPVTSGDSGNVTSGIRPVPGQEESLADNFIPCGLWEVCPETPRCFVQNCQKREGEQSWNLLCCCCCLVQVCPPCSEVGLLADCSGPGCGADEDSGWRETWCNSPDLSEEQRKWLTGH